MTLVVRVAGGPKLIKG